MPPSARRGTGSWSAAKIAKSCSETVNLSDVGWASSLPVDGASRPEFQAARCRSNWQTGCLPYGIKPLGGR